LPENVFIETLPNGLTLLAEHMPTVRSAAFSLLIPAGCIHDPPDRLGLSGLVAEMITRGAGPRSSRELMLAFDSLGLDRSESSGTLHLRLAGSTLARNLVPALELYADVVRRPHLPQEELPAVQALALQDLAALEDEPRQKVLIEVKKRHFPAPLGRDQRGLADHIEATTVDDLRRFWQRLVQPRGAILSVAGNLDWPALRDAVVRLFGDWEPQPEPPLVLQSSLPRREHLFKETQQTQIGIAYDSVPITHPDYYAAIGAVNVLSGGMSARLFTEVREKRGLCYAVWASHQMLKDRACVFCYAGTTNERAQETLEVTLAELARLSEGIDEDEVARIQAGMKAALIMQEESTKARAGALAGDWYYLGRVRPVAELQAAVDSLTAQRLADYARAHPPRDVTLVTIGPKPLHAPA
jgi:predicted Zn-dependent peptidase